jgi:hypothetical protein
LTGGFQGDSVVGDQSTGMDGAAACQISLGVGIGTNKIIRPIWASVWSIFKANTIIFLILLTLLAVFIAASAKRKGSGGG